MTWLRYSALAGLLCASSVIAEQSALEQAKQLLEQKQHQELQALLEPLQRSHAKDAEFWYLYGRAAMGLDDSATAEKHLKKAAELASDHAHYQFWYGQSSCNRAQSVNMLRARGFAIRCRDAFQAAADLEPEMLMYQHALAQFLMQAPSIAGGDIKQALAVAERIESFDSLQGQLLALQVHAANEDLAAFEALVARSDDLSKRPEPYVFRGFYHQQQNAHDQAIAEFEQAIQLPIDADDSEAMEQVFTAWYQIGRSALLGKTQLEKGIAALQHYRSQDDYNEWADLRLAQLYLLQDEQEQASQLIASLKANSQDKNLLAELNKISL
ncbi:hypothetical protein Q3O60_10660 [Alkalimonas collagenimarina]|uniref:Tetratricopeptide repeat protein n=1 Tax=Alkalimonas collagenimarina TaxID=400390 RepID=A0ABT9H035_9GAMM|nr:hypothetical protein [Alkalimonas collagenimarina]MDP4536651.1 hypothetical protein [Alkalimonas collagenimarina]